MGYFSNGHEGELFMARYCHQCLNWGRDSRSQDSQGCPVMDAHMFYNGEDAFEDLLELLIRTTGDANECEMYLPREAS